ENRVGALRQIHRIVIGEIQQKREHSDLNVLQIADTLAKHRLWSMRAALLPLGHDQVERLLGADVLVDQLFDRGGEIVVYENETLGVEDRRFLRAGGSLDAVAQMGDAILGARERV